MMQESLYAFTTGFFIIVLVGISLVSIHYRRRYEELKEWIRLMHQEKLDY